MTNIESTVSHFLSDSPCGFCLKVSIILDYSRWFSINGFVKKFFLLIYVLENMWFLYFAPGIPLFGFRPTRLIVHICIWTMKYNFSTLQRGFHITVFAISIVLWWVHTIYSSFNIQILWNLICRVPYLYIRMTGTFLLYLTLFIRIKNKDDIRYSVCRILFIRRPLSPRKFLYSNSSNDYVLNHSHTFYGYTKNMYWTMY